MQRRARLPNPWRIPSEPIRGNWWYEAFCSRSRLAADHHRRQVPLTRRVLADHQEWAEYTTRHSLIEQKLAIHLANLQLGVEFKFVKKRTSMGENTYYIKIRRYICTTVIRMNASFARCQIKVHQVAENNQILLRLINTVYLNVIEWPAVADKDTRIQHLSTISIWWLY